jgi:hypothetical protein
MEEPTPTATAPEPRGTLGIFHDLLTRPLVLLERAREARGLPLVSLLVGTAICYALYGAAAGFFQGGAQVWLAAFKVPLIIGMTFLLCLPSLFVFSALAGADWSGRKFLAVVSGFAATLGLLLAALLPISWLFSVSSRYLASAVWLHILSWLLAVGVGWRFLSLALRDSGARGAMVLWLLLFCAVSFQVATFLRPVLWRQPDQPLFTRGKMFFLEHMGKVYELDEANERAAREAANKPPSSPKAGGRQQGR